MDVIQVYTLVSMEGLSKRYSSVVCTFSGIMNIIVLALSECPHESEIISRDGRRIRILPAKNFRF